MSRDRFASKMHILAQECAETFNISPAIVAAQACLETGYGKSILSKKANNLFGILADPQWKGLKYPMKTRQFLHTYGWAVRNVYYRSYPTWTECIKNYCSILECQGATKESLDIAFLDNILPKADGIEFITDPRYREKILSIAKKWDWL